MSANDGRRQVWNNAFNEDTRAAQLQDDSAAWRGVTGLLLFIITIGVTLAMFTAWMCS